MISNIECICSGDRNCRNLRVVQGTEGLGCEEAQRWPFSEVGPAASALRWSLLRIWLLNRFRRLGVLTTVNERLDDWDTQNGADQIVAQRVDDGDVSVIPMTTIPPAGYRVCISFLSIADGFVSERQRLIETSQLARRDTESRRRSAARIMAQPFSINGTDSFG
jgi:hypothetical protein